MNALNKWIRILHRWLVIPFVVAISLMIFSGPAGDSPQSPSWPIVILIAALVLMVITGSYMFAQHYLRKVRRAQPRPSERVSREF